MLNRSELLKELTAAFLEPNVTGRVKIRYALQSAWMLQRGTDEMAAGTVGKNGTVLEVPIITQSTLKAPEFHYQMTAMEEQDDGKSASVFNDAFAVPVEERELDEAFYL